MYCSNCGTKLSEGARFCHNCGAPVISNAVFDAAEVPESVDTAAAEDIPVTEIPVPAFAAPEFTPAEPVISEAPVFEMPAGGIAQQASPYTSASPFIQGEPVYSEPPKDPFGSGSASSPYTYKVPGSQKAPSENEGTASDTYSGSVSDLPASTYTSAAGTVKKKKGSAKGILIALVILGLLFGGWKILSGKGDKNDIRPDPEPSPAPVPGEPVPEVTDPTELQEFKDALAAMEDGDYETAVAILEGLLEDYPEAREILSKLWDAYKQTLLSYVSSKDYSGGEVYALKWAVLDSASADTILSGFYKSWISDIIYGNVQDDLRTVAEKADPFLDEDLRELLDKYLNPANNTVLESIAKAIAENVDSQNYDTAAYAVLAADSNLRSSMSDGQPVRFTVEGYEHSSVVFYYVGSEDHFFAYYGDLDANGKREGNGTMLSSYMENDETIFVYWYRSGFENDLPNGQFTEMATWYQQDPLEVARRDIYRGTLVDGKYDGLFTENYDGVDYCCTMNKGRHTEILGENGDSVAVMVGVEDGTKYLWIPRDLYEGVYGVNDIYPIS